MYLYWVPVTITRFLLGAKTLFFYEFPQKIPSEQSARLTALDKAVNDDILIKGYIHRVIYCHRQAVKQFKQFYILLITSGNR